MKKALLTLTICSVLLISTGCLKKANEPQIPKSITVYQQLNLTMEQQSKLKDIRERQRIKTDELRQELDKKRNVLLQNNVDVAKMPEADRKKAMEELRKQSEAMRNELMELRNQYDKEFLGILDKRQEKIYKKYLEERNNEMKEIIKNAQKK
ncbi:MAG: hypothetical protein PHX18_06225 [Candidatus Gastranaerophilales bacterium]|nr:hypothetical protein [Candidatus Gastranaerophilales bacterium]